MAAPSTSAPAPLPWRSGPYRQFRLAGRRRHDPCRPRRRRQRRRHRRIARHHRQCQRVRAAALRSTMARTWNSADRSHRPTRWLSRPPRILDPLNHSAGFAGLISDFTGDGTLAGSDQIDLKDMNYTVAFVLGDRTISSRTRCRSATEQFALLHWSDLRRAEFQFCKRRGQPARSLSIRPGQFSCVHTHRLRPGQRQRAEQGRWVQPCAP